MINTQIRKGEGTGGEERAMNGVGMRAKIGGKSLLAGDGMGRYGQQLIAQHARTTAQHSRSGKVELMSCRARAGQGRSN